jgi:MoaA/NifB/PqqE/SkfB family radical SAM enzyme
MSCPKCITSAHRNEKTQPLTIDRIRDSLLMPYRFAGGKQLVISGGEPTLSENLLPLIESAVALRLKVFLASNLYRTDRQLLQDILELMNDRIHTFMFSYDSIIPEEMKRIRGVDAHSGVTENVHALLELKELLGNKPKIAACLVLQKENAGSIAETLKILVGLKLHKIIVQPVNM